MIVPADKQLHVKRTAKNNTSDKLMSKIRCTSDFSNVV